METIFDFITEQKNKYEKPITLAEGWDWSMKEHLDRSFLYLNSQFYEANEHRDLRPFKNIILPILNIAKRTEGFDVKDIELFVDNKDEYFKSLLIKKYHENWAVENEIDTFIDEVVDSFVDYGGVLVRKTKSVRPEVVDLRSLAYCNQNDLLNSPFAIRHELSFSQLRKTAKSLGWGGEGSDMDVETLISLVKKQDDDFVEVFECHGSMPVEWLEDDEIIDESEMDVGQIQVVAFYQDEHKQQQGVTLFKKKMPELPFKFEKRDEIKNRALGRGGVEELFEPQQWTNWNESSITEMLSSASKTLFFSDDPTFKSRNNLNHVQNNEVFSLQEGKTLSQLDTFPRNIQLFNESVDRFFQHAQLVGSASDPLLGETPSSGTPFKLFEAQQIESRGMHKHRQGKLAVFMDEIYRDWILPHLAREVSKEQIFMQELSAEEMQTVVQQVVAKKTNQFVKNTILSLQEVDPELVALYQQEVQADIVQQGSKRFFKILKDEMKDVTLSVFTNIAGKQKNLALMTDKVVNVLRQFIATPEIRQDPSMIKLVNVILESSGLSPITFSPTPAQAQGGGGNTQGLQGVSEANANERERATQE